jgi:TolB-like protein/DNA-binding winged helix-turn-helix (wHTH) protein/Flp pilus assembly protein TadD
VDLATNRVSRAEETVKLEPKVMKLLAYLADRPAKVITREELEAQVWAGSVVGYDTLTGAIQKLRKAFHDDPKNPRIIETLSKKGYRLVAPVNKSDGTIKSTDTASIPKRFMQTGLGVVLMILSVTAFIFFWISPWESADNIVAVGPSSLSIAVLPFDNLSGDPGQEYFADGITDDLITGLAKNPALFVIARDSTFLYKKQSIDVYQVAERLNVRYILRGSVRQVREQLRINVQLVDTSSGAHLWAESYKGEKSTVFGLQELITQKIFSVLTVKTSAGAQQDLGRPHTNNPQAYDNFLIGRQHFYLYLNKDENLKARRHFQSTIEFDPNFAIAYAMLGWTHVFEVMNGWSDARDRSLLRAEELALKAVSLQAALPVAYFVKGLVYREREEYVKALVEAEKAIGYDPNYANAHVLLATLLYYAGRPQEGLDRIKKAIQLNPHHPYNYAFHLGQAYYILGRYAEAIDAFNQGIASNPASERLHVWLAAAYAQAGQSDEAEWEMDQVLTINPEFSLKRMQQAFPFKEAKDREHFIAGLRKAGLTQ